MGEDGPLLEETASALREIGELHAKVELALLEAKPVTAQYDGLASWRARLEDFHCSLVLAYSRWRLGTTEVCLVRRQLARWKEDPTRGAL
jgi:hypothetical protein